MKKSVASKNFLKPLSKGLLASVCLSVIGVFIFAFLYRFLKIDDIVIKVINQIIKVLSVVLGCVVTFKMDKSKGILKGGLLGSLYTVCSFLLFSLLACNFNINLSLLYDLIFASVIGMICGIFMVSFRSK